MDNNYPEYIMRNVRQTLDIGAYDPSLDDTINNMPKLEVLRRYWQWEGIIGYETEMIRVIEAIFGVNIFTDED